MLALVSIMAAWGARGQVTATKTINVPNCASTFPDVTCQGISSGRTDFQDSGGGFGWDSLTIRMPFAGSVIHESLVTMSMNGNAIGPPVSVFGGVCPTQPLTYEFKTSSLRGYREGDFNTVAFSATGAVGTWPSQDCQLIFSSTASMQMLDGDGQRGVIGSPVERNLRVRFTTKTPGFDLSTLNAVFEVTSAPKGASGYGIGADDSAVSPTTYSARANGDGVASVTLLLGDTGGAYVVQVKGLGSTTGQVVTFTGTGVKPDKVAVLKDTMDVADLSPAFAVPATQPTTFYAIGLDGAGQKIGPMKCGWTVSASGSPATRGDGTLAPVVATKSATFTPTKPGQLMLVANTPLKGVKSGSVGLFISSLYVSVENSFTPSAPVDEAPRFLPGMYLDGSNVALNVMEATGQFISLHLLTGGAKGKATFTVDSTNYPGIAMNSPLSGDLTEDMLFTNGQQSVTMNFDPSTGDTWTSLLVRDYGASGTILVSIQSGKTTYALKPLRLPFDADGNGLPDEPWKIGGNVISPAGLTATDDVDDDNNPATPHKGDGLSAYEEMRGLVATGAYTRLDPRRRDFFLVADLDLLAFGTTGVSATPISYLVPLPLSNHYLELDEVVGEDFPARQLLKIKPVVNPNRAGVPGSRAEGQRAVRAIHQAQFWPSVTVFIPANPAPIEQDVPVWQYGVFGATVLDTTNYDEIDRTQTGDLVTSFAAASPNETSFVEWYAKTFENAGVHTDFADGLINGFHDEHGNLVSPCLAPNDVGCDVWEDHLIVPRSMPGGYLDELHTVPEYPGDYYTRRAFACSDMTNDVAGGMSMATFAALKAAVVAHEVGHAIHLDHQPLCGALMFDATLFGLHRGMSDVIPIALKFAPSEVDAIRLRK
ncbi:MAG: hypothetical protein ABI779_18905 [Acidobacteriota bacterium]